MKPEGNTQIAVEVAAKPARSGANSKIHVPVLDGVRGMAILLVMLLHFFFVPMKTMVGTALYRFCNYGWAGVDLFFVLSGFLITGILLDSKSKPNFFKNFYARRVLRIFPLYYIYLIVLGLGMAGLILLAKPSIASQAKIVLNDVYYALFYLTNFKMAYTGDRLPYPTNHFWSLAIEEQFYLLWPLLVYFATSRTMTRICLGIIVGAPALRLGLQMAGVNDMASHVLMPCRADSLAWGALVALIARSPGGLFGYVRIARWVFWTGGAVLAGLVMSGIQINETARNLLFVLNNIVFSSVVLIALTSPAEGMFARFFSNRTLCSFGKYAYALYVLNQLVSANPASKSFCLRLMRIESTGLVGELIYAALGISLSYFLAWVSWVLIENRFLKLKRYFE